MTRALTLPMRAKIPSGFKCDLEVWPVSTHEGRELSPFFLGPCTTPSGIEFQNMENLWQFSKVYPQLGHVNDKGLPSDEWRAWHKHGAADTRARRYPAGKGQVPAYSWWNRHCLSYIAARKMIYIPEYAKLAAQTDLYKQLRREYRKGANIVIRDYDAYSIWGTDTKLIDVFSSTRRAGHGFVISGVLAYGTRFYRSLIV